MSTMNQQIFDRKNGLTCTLHSDYYLPNLNLSDAIKPRLAAMAGCA